MSGIALVEIAEKVGGTVDGDGSVIITGLASLSDAQAGDISFLSNARYAREVEATMASAVIAGRDWSGPAPCALLRVDNPDKAFMMTGMLFMPPPASREPGIHSSAVVDKSAELDASVCVGPHCVIEEGVRIGRGTVLVAGVYVGKGTVIGEGCLVYSNVSLREHISIGSRAIIHCGAVIGSDGFGYYKEGEKWKKIPQTGTVIVGDDVEIGANVTIDRARFGKTVIGNGVKIDNLVQVAHNVRVGDNTAMAAQVGIAGSAVIGRNVQLGGQAGVAGHLTVGDDVTVGGKAGVISSVPGGIFVSGFPAIAHRESMRMQANIARVPELKKKVAELERKLEAMGRDGVEGGGSV